MARCSDSALYPGSVKVLRLWHGARFRALTRTLSTLLASSFLIPSLVFAFEPANYPTDSVKTLNPLTLMANGAKIQVAPELGRVLNAFQGKQDRVIVYIHDLHCNYEVQSNIARLLDALVKKNSLRLVGIEGESQPINTSAYASFPVAAVKNSTADYFLRKGRITGAEYLAIVGDQSLDLQGIETQGLYDADKKSLLQFLTDESQGHCEDLRNVLERLKAPLYSMELSKLDHLRQQLDFESTNLETYCGQLLAEADRLGVATAPFPTLSQFAATRRQPVSSGSDYDKLLADAEGLDRALREKLYTSPDQRQLDHYLRLIKIMENLIGISATAADLEYFRAHRGEFAVAEIVKFLDTICYRNAIDLDLGSGILKLDEYLDQAAHFYEVADRRSAAFVTNTLRLMSADNRKLAVLITGGYHSSQVEEALRREGVSYVTIKPRMTRTGDENPYFSLLRNQRAPIEKLLDQNQDILAPQSAFNPLFERLFRRHWSLVLGMELPMHFVAKAKMSMTEALQEAEKVRQEVLNSPGPIPFGYQDAMTNPAQDIILLTIPNSRFSVVIRKAVVRSGKNSYGYDFLVREDLDNGYEFQIIANEQEAGGRYVLSNAQIASVLGTARPGGMEQAAFDKLTGETVKVGKAGPSLAARFEAWRAGAGAGLAQQWARAGRWAGSARAALAQGGRSALGFLGDIRQNSARVRPGVYIAGAVVLAVALAAALTVGLPAILPVFALQLTLALALGAMVYFFAGHPMASPGARRLVRVTAGIAGLFIIAGVFFSFGPLVATSALAAGIGTSAASAGSVVLGGKAVWLGMIAGVGIFPVLARISRGILNPEKSRSGRLTPEDWDRIERAQAQARTVGYGMPMASGAPLNDILLRVILKEKEYEAAQAQAEKTLKAAQAALAPTPRSPGEDAQAAEAALQQAQTRAEAAGRAVKAAKSKAESFKRLSGTTAGLAMLGIAWHQGATLPAALLPLGGEENMLAFADEFLQGEFLAQTVLDGKPLTPEMLQNNSWLAQLARQTNAKQDQTPAEFTLGTAAAPEPLRLLALLWGGAEGKQALAMAKLVKAAQDQKGLTVRLGDPLANPAFGFQRVEMDAQQVTAMSAELGKLSAALGTEMRTLALASTAPADLSVQRPGVELTGQEAPVQGLAQQGTAADRVAGQSVATFTEAESRRAQWNLQAYAGRALQAVRQSQNELSRWVQDSPFPELRAAWRKPAAAGAVEPEQVKALRQAIQQANELEKNLLELMQQAGRMGVRSLQDQMGYQRRIWDAGKALTELQSRITALQTIAEAEAKTAEDAAAKAARKQGRADSMQARLEAEALAAEKSAERIRVVAIQARRTATAAEAEVERLAAIFEAARAKRARIEQPLTEAIAAKDKLVAEATALEAKAAKAEQRPAVMQDGTVNGHIRNAEFVVESERKSIKAALDAALEQEAVCQAQVEMATKEAVRLSDNATVIEKAASRAKTLAADQRARVTTPAAAGTAARTALDTQSAAAQSWTALQVMTGRLGTVLGAEGEVLAQTSLLGGNLQAGAQQVLPTQAPNLTLAASGKGGIAYYLRDLLFDWFGLKPSAYNRYAGLIEYGLFWVLLGGTFGSLAVLLGLTSLPLVTVMTVIAAPAFLLTHLLRYRGGEKTPVINIVLAGVIAVFSLGLAFSPLAVAVPLLVIIAPLPFHVLLNLLTAAVNRRTQPEAQTPVTIYSAADDYAAVVQDMTLDASREAQAPSWLQRLTAPRSAPGLGSIWNGLEAVMRHSLAWISARVALGSLLRTAVTSWAISQAQSGRNLGLTVRVLLFLGLVRPGQETGTLISDMPMGRRTIWLGAVLNRNGIRLLDRDNNPITRPLRTQRFMEMA